MRDVGFRRRAVPQWREMGLEFFGRYSDELELQESTLTVSMPLAPPVPFPPGCNWAYGSKYN
jgi:hypothetical protein